MGVNSLPKTVTSTASWLWFEPRPFCAWVQHANHSATEPPSIAKKSYFFYYYNNAVYLWHICDLSLKGLMRHCLHRPISGVPRIAFSDVCTPRVRPRSPVVTHEVCVFPQCEVLIDAAAACVARRPNCIQSLQQLLSRQTLRRLCVISSRNCRNNIYAINQQI